MGTGDADLSIVSDDLPFRVQRKLHLIPAHGLGVVRRAALFGLVAWLPIAIWAIVVERFLPGRTAEPFLHQFSIHARCLIAIPLFVLAEATVFNVGRMIVTRLVDQGFVVEADRPRLRALLASFVRVRDATLPWIFIAGGVVALMLLSPTVERNQEVLFAPGPADAPGRLTFGAIWYLYVSRTIFTMLFLAWIWRMLLWTYAMARLARLDLALVPTHPDRMFGLAMLSRTPTAFWPFVLGATIVLASVWAHDVLFNEVPLSTYHVPLAIYVVLLLVLLLAPLVVFVPKFAAAKRNALAEYGALLAAHGRLVHRKWIAGEAVREAPILDAPELGPVADTVSLYQAVRAQGIAPIGKSTLFAILLPIALPMLIVAALQIPVGQLLLRLVKTVL